MSQVILVVGSLNMDQVLEVPRLPRMGETLAGAGDVRFVPGGKGANQAVALARLFQYPQSGPQKAETIALPPGVFQTREVYQGKPNMSNGFVPGGKVAMAGRVGQDSFGSQLRQALEADGINTDLLVSDAESASGTAFIFLNPEKENAILLSPGANAHVGKDMQQHWRILEALDAVQVLVLQLEIPLESVQTYIREAHARGVQVVLNLAPAQPLPLEILQQVSLLILNESEISLLIERNVESVEEAREAALILHRRGIQTVVVTLGAHGALLVTGEEQVFYQEAFKVEPVDTTAAGDCFVGALVVALAEGQEYQQALRFAVAASALKVGRFGAQLGIPRRDEVQRFLAQQTES